MHYAYSHDEGSCCKTKNLEPHWLQPHGDKMTREEDKSSRAAIVYQ
jgi:hypothetical protein